ncbi:GGDEF domain-containing response regulator [Aestuariirhabdus sp. LZHN29]|uniref:GGDEF domain-containing response regulator n=1 Tax=Aestuariirhabdus sp. LZHN29 TaxID=3417462 RepID=UPI003CF1F39F
MKQVLIVEDSPTVLKVMDYLMRQQVDFEPVYAATLAEVDIMMEEGASQFFAAIVDLNLPDAPNGEAVERIRQHQIPTIVLTGSFNEAQREQMLASGVVDYVEKEGRLSYEYAVSLLSKLARNQRLTLMVVDDSSSARLFVKEILLTHLYEVILAESGEQALELLGQNPDLTLMIVDYNMPGMNGCQLVKEIRQQKSYDDLLIIGLSAGERSLSARFIKAGANDFLKKPFYHEELHCRVMHNIEQRELLVAVRNMANRDYLTGLDNRRYFFEQAQPIYDTACKKGGVFAIAMIDIDHFKQVNDTYGHAIGDDVLKSVAGELKRSFTRFVAARMGGEEFCVLLSGLGEEQAYRLLERFRELVSQLQVPTEQGELSVTISVGLSVSPGNSLDAVIQQADQNLYRAKEAGRNLVVSDEAGS